MDEEIQDVAADIGAEEIVEPIQPEEVIEETVAPEVEELRKAKAQLTARAKKAEEELKALKAKPQVNINQNDPQLSDELKLIARGLSDEEIEQAKVIAKGKGVNLVEAIKDPLFIIYQGDLKDKERKEKAKLGASKGSGQTQEEVTGLQPGSSREDHMKAFNKKVGRK